MPPGPLLVAIADDDEVYRAFTAAMLKAKDGNFEVFEAASGEDLMALLGLHPIACVLLDYNMGVETGLSINERIKARFADPPAIVMLTGEGGERTVIKAFKGGISDYVPKQGLKQTELIRAIREAVAQKQKERADRVERETLLRKLPYDPVTGLFGRPYIDDYMLRMEARAKRTRDSCGVFAIALNGVSDIVDRYGQLAGDRMLRAFAARLQSVTRETDLCGTHEDGFFIYLIDTKVDAAAMASVASRLAGALTFDADIDSLRLRLTPSIAGAIFPRDGETLAAALETAKAGSASAASHSADALPAPGTAWRPVTPADGPAATRQREGDRRREPRHRVLKQGQIIAKGAGGALDCMIRDLSAAGARLRLNSVFPVPQTFDLRFPSTGELRPVRVRWQVGNEVGVEFV